MSSDTAVQASKPPTEAGLAPETAPALEPHADATEDRGTATPASPRGNLARSLFTAEIDAEAGGRNFQYNQPITANLRSYDVTPAPLLRAAGELFPLADSRLTGGGALLRDVGLFGDYSRALFLKSAVKGGASLDTNETAYMIGLRLRIHPAGDNGPIFGISDSYAVQLLTFATTGTALDGQLPAARYAANRIGLDGRMPFGSLAGFVGLGYRLVLDGGPIDNRFRGSKVSGVDAHLGGAYMLTTCWEVRIAAHYERYFYGFKPKPGDSFVAGGALDQFFGARLGVAYVF